MSSTEFGRGDGRSLPSRRKRHFPSGSNTSTTIPVHRTNEAVPAPGQRFDICGSSGGVAELFAQLVYGGVEAVFKVAEAVGGPELLLQFLTGDQLAGVGGEVAVEVIKPVCIASVLDAVEAAYPVLKGTIRDHATLKRRPFLRFFAAGEDISLEPANNPLPDSIEAGKEPLLVVGAIAGG